MSVLNSCPAFGYAKRGSIHNQGLAPCVEKFYLFFFGFLKLKTATTIHQRTQMPITNFT
jgi:hypothetical protein